MKKKWIVFSVGSLALLAFATTARGAADGEEDLQGGTLGARIKCNGTICGGTGGMANRHYVYEVIPINASNPVDTVEIGTDMSNTNFYSQFVLPTGWTLVGTFAIPRAHDIPFTAHGNVTASGGQCTHILRFQGPQQTASFEIGFNVLDAIPHDVSWKALDNAGATSRGTSSYSFALGLGRGPVHGPISEDDPRVEEPPH
jgi:hypothetical protein